MHEIFFSKEAEDFLNKLDNNIKKRISSKIELLKANPELGKPLTANLAGLWSLRIGDFRVIYQIKNQELAILIIKLGHRKNVYE